MYTPHMFRCYLLKGGEWLIAKLVYFQSDKHRTLLVVYLLHYVHLL